MTLALITAKQVIVLFILIFSGFICVKTGVVKIEGRKAFSDLLVYFVVPCMIINSYLTEFDDNIFKNILYALGLSILLLVVGFAITFLLSFKLKGDNVPIVRFGCMFSNAAYMGFPLIQALFGSEGLIYASAFVCAPTGDPEYFFTTHCLKNSSKNRGGYYNEQLEQLEEQLSTTFDTEGREQLGIKMTQTILDDNAFIFASHLKMSIVSGKGVSGLTAHPSDYYEITAELDMQ